MDRDKKERLEAKGWKVGTVSEFLELTPEETALVEIRLALSRTLNERRQRLMTQAELADKIHSSQPRIAKAENGDVSVSIELLIRAILATGATPQEIGQVIASTGSIIA
ncbi:helix-turn-helix domain-containing protein [Scytonema sp. NUACC26]|uniref:helix-turn-helix domain-containing protein n=1 Tax=Scytonema sp. NUACC26 TaxID=3140176 RepID=UPI0038B3C2AD